jgi:large subunit ribosomal protein L21e
MIRLSTYMQSYKVGDYVDIKANAACQRGMPYRFYHGKTGVVFNVAPRALGVIVHKPVRSRLVEKRINVRIEHVQPSKCQQDFLARARANTKISQEAKANGGRIEENAMKRSPARPRAGHFVSSKNNEPVLIAPIPYEILI